MKNHIINLILIIKKVLSKNHNDFKNVMFNGMLLNGNEGAINVCKKLTSSK